MGEVGSDEWYAYNALKVFEQLGWSWIKECDSDPCVKLIHPQGREKFSTCGVVFIDVDSSKYPYHFVRLCALFPGQRMPLHHHLERSEVFTVVAGVVRADGDTGEMLNVPPGDLLSPAIGEKHGVSTDQRGGIYVGVCDKSHLTDVYWTDEDLLVEPAKRVTLPPLNTQHCLPLPEWSGLTVSRPVADSLEAAWQHSLKMNTTE
jgi:quercetin dioxygenase-like cupin family protein